MRVFLDTSVLVSAVTTRGLCADIFRAVLVDHELVVCPKVLREARRVSRTKFMVPERLVSDYLDLLRRDSVVAEAGEAPDIQVRDRDDIEIVAGAIAAHADVLVTGDGELQRLKSVGGVRILSPRAFWEELKTSQGNAPGRTRPRDHDRQSD